MLCPGDVFGEVAMLDGGPRTADAVARVDSLVTSLDRRRFFALFPSESEAYEYVVRLPCSASVRLASRLLMFGDGDTGGWIRVSQQELADMAGIVREYVDRLLGEWEDAGSIECSSRPRRPHVRRLRCPARAVPTCPM